MNFCKAEVRIKMTLTVKLLILIAHLGIANCQWFDSELTGYFKRQGDAPLNDIRYLTDNNLASLQECADICTPVDECRGFFHDTYSNSCWPKYTEGFPLIPYWNGDGGYIYTKGVRLENCNATLVGNDLSVTLTTSTVEGNNQYTYGPYNSYIDSATETFPNLKAGCWKADVADQNQWWQVEFPEPRIVQAVITQGCDQQGSWVVDFTVLFSDDGVQFSVVGESDTRGFIANTNSDEKVVNLLPETLTKFVRIQPKTVIGGKPGMRVEILGCAQHESEHMGYLMETGLGSLSVSSVYNSDTVVYGPTRAYLNSALYLPTVMYGAWKAGSLTQDQYIQVTFPNVYEVNAVSTQGANGVAEWVTSYDILHSFNGIDWYVKQQGLTGNTDSDGKVTNTMTPFLAKSIRIVPQTWQGYISMRVGVFGTSSTEPTSLTIILCDECTGNVTAVTDKDTSTCLPIPLYRDTRLMFPLEVKVMLPYNLTVVSIHVIGVALKCAGPNDQFQLVTVLNNEGLGTLYKRCVYKSGLMEAGLSVCTYTCEYIDSSHTFLAGVMFSNDEPGTICEIELS